MAPDERRASIVDVAIPLLKARGDSIKVAEVANAAGVAEATVFKVFPTRKTLIFACLDRVASTATMEDSLRALRDMDNPKRLAVLTDIAECFERYLSLAGPVFQAVGPSNATAFANGGMEPLIRAETLLLPEIERLVGSDNKVTDIQSITRTLAGSLYANAVKRDAGLDTPSINSMVVAIFGAALGDAEKT